MWLLDGLQCSQQTFRSLKPSVDPTAFNDRAKTDALSARQKPSLGPDSSAISRKIIFEEIDFAFLASHNFIDECSEVASRGRTDASEKSQNLRHRSKSGSIFRLAMSVTSTRLSWTYIRVRAI